MLAVINLEMEYFLNHQRRFRSQQEIQVDKSGCEEDELGEEMEEFLVEAPARIMPEDKSLPLYQVESFALEGSPDQPMDMFQGTIYKKRVGVHGLSG